MGEKLPLVSIITPNYNYAHFIGDTIMSVIKQDYPKIEYIVVDDGSTDNSVSVVKDFQSRYPNRITLLRQENRGQSAALNRGFRRSKGEILCWLNSDDQLEPSAVSIAVVYLNRHKHVGMVFGERIVIDSKGNFLRLERNSYWGRLHFQYGQRVAQEASFWRRELFFDIGLVDEQLRFCMDYDLFIRFSKAAKIAFLPVALGRYRDHPASKSVKVAMGTFEMGREEMRRTMEKHFGSEPSGSLRYILSSRVALFICAKYNRLVARKDVERAVELRANSEPWRTRINQSPSILDSPPV